MSPAEASEQFVTEGDPRLREQYLAIAATLPESVAYTLTRARALTTSSPDDALRYAAAAAEIAVRQEEPALAGAAWRVYGQALRVLGRHTQAISAFEQAADFARDADDERLAAQVQIGSIDSLGMLGRYNEATQLARRLESDLRAVGAEEDAARALANLGSVHFRRDRYLEAWGCYSRARDILRQHGDPLFGAAIGINCANVLTQLNRLDEAIVEYRKASAIYQERGLSGERAVVETNLGFLEHMSGRPAAAVGLLDRAHTEFARLGRVQDAARCDITAATAYRTLNLYPEALVCCDRAITAAESLKLEYDRARAELCRGSTLLALGRFEEGLVALSCAESVFRSQRNSFSRAHVRLTLAYHHHSQGRMAEAGKEAGSAARTFARARLPGWAAEARFVLADIQLREGQDAARRMRAVVRSARTAHRGWLECRAERSLGHFHAKRGELDRAIGCLRSGVQALERARTQISPEGMHVAFLQDKQAAYEELVSLLLERNTEADRAEALECAERARSRLLLERIQDALEGVSPPALGELGDRLARLRAELSRAHRLTQQDGAEDPRRLAPVPPDAASALSAAETAYLEGLRVLELRSPSHVLRPLRVPALSELQRALAAGEALIQFHLLGERVCAFVVSSEGLTVFPSLACTEVLRGLARRLRYHLQRMELADRLPVPVSATLLLEVQAVLRDLYEKLLAPLEGVTAGCSHLVLAPHGFLHGLPFHAFFDGQTYALDRWEVLYAPSASIWLATARESQSERQPAQSPLLMSFAAPGIDQVTAEVEGVGGVLSKAQVCHGDAATLQAFRRAAPESDIVHLATHARFRQDNPLFSGLQLADGWLLARDLYEMRLRCRLATLSACHTGTASVEAGDELFGLVRGFLGAGAGSVAASLWAAHDHATAQLMQRFYLEITSGASFAAALRSAQRHLRAEYPHPYHWAAFVLVGHR